MPFLDHQGHRLHYLDIDNRPNPSRGFPIVFVHGAGTSHLIWSMQMEEFSKTHRVVVPDLLGHGLSDEVSDDADIETGYVAEIATLLEHLDLRDFVIVGHSMGGAVTMAYTLNRKLRQPRAIALVCTSPDLETSRILPGLAVESFESYLAIAVSHLTGIHSNVYKIRMKERALGKSESETVGRDLKACDRFDITSRVCDIEVPTFVICGEDDDVFPPGIAQALNRMLPHSDIAIIKKGDHTPMVDMPEIFNPLLRKFLVWVEKSA
ncbi:alpha/beta hydrolase [Candidatus Thorarchaeota archaeon]|nr:MAG: alpha/beta hydrolase [Candidatus Thorarchaeota archaeon]